MHNYVRIWNRSNESQFEHQRLKQILGTKVTKNMCSKGRKMQSKLILFHGQLKLVAFPLFFCPKNLHISYRIIFIFFLVMYAEYELNNRKI